MIFWRELEELYVALKMNPWYWRDLYDIEKVISRKMKQKKNFRESNLWPHVSCLVILTFISSPENLKSKYINILKCYTVLMKSFVAFIILVTVISNWLKFERCTEDIQLCYSNLLTKDLIINIFVFNEFKFIE
jgi:hypothetical protein